LLDELEEDADTLAEECAEAPVRSFSPDVNSPALLTIDISGIR
jgi:hypothetical protein